MRILFMGRKKVAARALQRLIDDPVADVVGVLTDSHLAQSVTADLARANGIPVLDFDQTQTRLEAGELQIDLAFSMLFWRRLKGAFLSAPRHGVINFHPAPLPTYRGVGGYNLAILEGLDQWAASAHFIDADIDTGPIVATLSFPIDRDRETAQTLEATSQIKLMELFDHVWELCKADPAALPRLPNVGGRHLSRKQLEAMKRIDPTNDDVARKIRAFWFPPYDGAWIEVGGERCTLVSRAILEALADPDASSLFSPKA
jgi:methionyl-tRNA formyltransferase